MLRDIHKLVPMMQDDSARAVYMDVLLALRKVNNGIFGLQLDPNWSSLIADMKSSFSLLAAKQGMPLTPKFHIIMEHVEELIQMNGRSLGI